MAHTAHDEKLLSRVRRLRGQIEAVERGIEAGADCAKVLHLIAASRGAINALMTEVLEGHVREHLIDPATERSKGGSAAHRRPSLVPGLSSTCVLGRTMPRR